MRKRYVLVILCIHLFLEELKATENENLAIRMINDIITTFDQPTSVTAFLCNQFDSIALIRELSKKYITVSVHKTTLKSLPRPFPPSHALFLLDLFCNNSLDLLVKANEMNLFSSPYRWLILTKQETNLEIGTTKSPFSSINALVDSEVTITNLVKENFYNITKIFKRNSDFPLVQQEVGYWTPETGVVFAEFTKITARQRKNLLGSVLRASIVVTCNDSLNHLTDRRDSHIDTITKVNYVLLQHLGNIVNSTLIFSMQNTWGYKNNRSEWNGMIGELLRREADIGGTPLFVTSDRVPVIDYVSMTSPTRSKFVFREPKLSYVTNVYVLPFHWTVWISLLALIIITATGLYVAVKWDWHKRRFRHLDTKSGDSELQDSWLDIIMLSFGAMCQQGASSMPYSIPGRIITILLFISLMFLYTSYSANIVALLQSPSNSIQSLSDLLHSRLDVGVDDTVFNHFYFPNASEPVRKALYLQKVAPPGQRARFFSMAEGVKKMRAGHFAFHMETGVGYQFVAKIFMEHEKCGLQEIQFLQVPEPWIALQKNTSFREILKIGLRQIQESGLQARENSLLYTKKPACINRGSSFVSVGIVDCYLAAAVLFAGIIFAFVLFVLEFAISYRLHGFITFAICYSFFVCPRMSARIQSRLKQQLIAITSIIIPV